MYNYQSITSSQKYGGFRAVLTGIQHSLLSGRFTVDLDRVPEVSVGILPATTPIFADEVNRIIDVHYAFSVSETATSTATKIKLTKGYEGTRVKAGMALMIAPTTIEGKGKSLAVVSVNSTNEGYDEITVASGGFGSALTAGSILIEADKVSDTEASIKVLPNAILPYDLGKLPNATLIWADALFCQTDGVLLENRIPPIAEIIKAYMRSKDVYIRYSKSAE